MNVYSLVASTHTYRLNRLLVATFLATALSACGGGGGGDTDGNDDAIVEPSTVGDEIAVVEPTLDGVEGEMSTASELPFLDSGETISGSLATDEFITYRVPADSQVLLTSDTGSSDLLLLDTPEIVEESVVCIDQFPFQEDVCSGDGSTDFLYATVLSVESGDYTLSVTNDCSVGSINQWVYRSMQDYYLFADQVPTVNPLDYDSPSALIQDIRFNELDPFSSIFNVGGNPTLTEEGRTIGFGHFWRRDSDGNLRVLNVHTDSPFGRNGVKRGDIFHSLGGILSSDLTDAQFADLVGPDDNPKLADWTFEDGETGELKSFVVAKAEYSINTIAYASLITNSGSAARIGYVVFNTFLLTSVDELDTEINNLRESNINELILDLRYNTGGRVAVADRLAAQLSGNRLTGQVLKRRQFNDAYSNLNSDDLFSDSSPALDLSRVIVLTTSDTASASETVINALKPYMEVITIGERSLGKPFVSNLRNFCGATLNVMNSQTVNASNVSAAGGIEATCFAEDDPTRNYGIAQSEFEEMLGSAVDYVLFGTCDVAPTTTLASRKPLEIKSNTWESTGDIEVLGTPRGQ